MEHYNPGQIKKFLKQLRQREEQYIYYLGQLAFQAGEEQRLSEPAMLEAYRTLKDIKAQIAQWEASLAQIKVAKEAAQRPRCPNCGGEVVKGALYCPTCGGALAAPPGVGAAPTAPVTPVYPAQATPVMPPSAMPGPIPPGMTPSPAPVAGAPVMPAPAPGTPAPPAPAPVPPVSTPVFTQAQQTAAYPQSAPLTPPAPRVRSCPNCGESLDDDALFCGNCGVKVASGLNEITVPPREAEAVEESGEGETAPQETAWEPAGSMSGEWGQGVSTEVAAGEPLEATLEKKEESAVAAAMQPIGVEVAPAQPSDQEAANLTQATETEGYGASAGVSEDVTPDDTIACPSCWTSIADLDARFCPNCGAKVRE